MDFRTKILATLWITTVVMWLGFWAMPNSWMHEPSPRYKFMCRYTGAAFVVTFAAVVYTVIYGLMWVWG